jgi:hypothetical protein
MEMGIRDKDCSMGWECDENSKEEREQKKRREEKSCRKEEGGEGTFRRRLSEFET